MAQKLTAAQDKEVGRVFQQEVFGAVSDDDPLEKRNAELKDLHNRGVAALKQAERASHKGDLAAAKKWTDVSAQMLAAYRRLDETELPSTYEDEEALRADIRARVGRFVTGEQELERWEWRNEIWQEMAGEAARLGLPQPAPMPPKPEHWTDKLPEGLRQLYLAQQAEEEV